MTCLGLPKFVSGGFGPGEITDIARLVDLAVQSGLKAVHLESLSSPPWAPSDAGLSHAVHPCYINLKSIPSLGEAAGAARDAAKDLLNGDAERVFDAKVCLVCTAQALAFPTLLLKTRAEDFLAYPTNSLLSDFLSTDRVLPAGCLP